MMRYLIFCFGLFISSFSYGQANTELEGGLGVKGSADFDGKVHVKGTLSSEKALKIGEGGYHANTAGVIRWNGRDFEGWNGKIWVSLTGGRILGSVTDIDGNTYETMRFGQKEWMLENLKVTKYNDGGHLSNIEVNSTWIAQTSGAWCWTFNHPPNDDRYGKLYNFYAVETGKLCPTGWSAPSQEEWHQLLEELGGMDQAGFIMKDIQSNLWDNATIGNNESGFSARPAGYRRHNEGNYQNARKFAYFWTGGPFADLAIMGYNSANVYFNQSSPVIGASVRCVRDYSNN